MEDTIYVIDDQPVIRQSLEFLLESVGMPVELFASAEEFLARQKLPQSGCLLLDIKMSGMDGLELQQELVKKQCRLPIIFITGHGDIHTAVQTIKEGAFDFIEKPFREDELLEKIRLALQCNQKQAAEDEQMHLFLEHYHRLSLREQQILREIVAGKLNKVTARELGISQKTVENHRANIMRKLPVDSLALLMHHYTVCEIRGFLSKGNGNSSE